MKFRAVLRAINEGGQVEVHGSELIVSKADAVTLLIVAATDYRGGDPAAACARYLARAAKPYSALKAAHVVFLVCDQEVFGSNPPAPNDPPAGFHPAVPQSHPDFSQPPPA